MSEIRNELLAILRGKSNATRLLEAVYEEDEIRLLRNADLVLFQGEGTMVGTRFYNGENLFVAPIIAAKIYKKPVWSINQTAFSLDAGFTEFMCEAYVSAFERNYLREAASLNYLRSLGVSNCSLLPDMAFFDIDSQETNDVDEQYPAMSGMARIERLPANVFESIAEILIDRYSKLTFLASTNMDMAMAGALKSRFGPRIDIVGSDCSRYEALSAIRSSSIFVSGRYHMNIFAAKANTAFVPFLSNTHKNHGLTQMLDYPISPRVLEIGYSLEYDLDYVEKMRPSLENGLKKNTGRIVSFLENANIFESRGAEIDFTEYCRMPESTSDFAEKSYFSLLNAPKEKSTARPLSRGSQGDDRGHIRRP